MSRYLNFHPVSDSLPRWLRPLNSCSGLFIFGISTWWLHWLTNKFGLFGAKDLNPLTVFDFLKVSLLRGLIHVRRFVWSESPEVKTLPPPSPSRSLQGALAPLIARNQPESTTDGISVSLNSDNVGNTEEAEAIDEGDLAAVVQVAQDQAFDRSYLKLLLGLHGVRGAQELIAQANNFRKEKGGIGIEHPWEIAVAADAIAAGSSVSVAAPPSILCELGEFAACGMLRWHGYDLDGRPVLFLLPHLCPAWRKKDPVEYDYNLILKLHLLMFEFGRYICVASGSPEFTFILDTSIVAVQKSSLSFVQMMLPFATTGYVDRLHKLWVGPLGYQGTTFFNMVKPIYTALCKITGLPPGLDKVMVMTDIGTDLSKILGESQVPEVYGGPEPFPERFDWNLMVNEMLSPLKGDKLEKAVQQTMRTASANSSGNESRQEQSRTSPESASSQVQSSSSAGHESSLAKLSTSAKIVCSPAQSSSSLGHGNNHAQSSSQAQSSSCSEYGNNHAQSSSQAQSSSSPELEKSHAHSNQSEESASMQAQSSRSSGHGNNHAKSMKSKVHSSSPADFLFCTKSEAQPSGSAENKGGQAQSITSAESVSSQAHSSTATPGWANAFQQLTKKLHTENGILAQSSSSAESTSSQDKNSQEQTNSSTESANGQTRSSNSAGSERSPGWANAFQQLTGGLRNVLDSLPKKEKDQQDCIQKEQPDCSCQEIDNGTPASGNSTWNEDSTLLIGLS